MEQENRAEELSVRLAEEMKTLDVLKAEVGMRQGGSREGPRHVVQLFWSSGDQMSFGGKEDRAGGLSRRPFQREGQGTQSVVTET